MKAPSADTALARPLAARMGRTLRLRLLLSLLAVGLVAAAAIGASVYWSVLRQTERLFDYQLRQMALSLRDQGEIAPEDARALSGQQLDFVVQIWTEDGRAVYVSGHETAEPPNRAVLGYADITGGGELWRTYGVIARDRVIQVAQPQRIRHAYAAQVALRSISPLALLAPLLALVIAWLVSRSLAPLQRLAAEVRSRDSGSLQALPARGLPDEVRPLVESLNALLARLGEALASQRHFVSDAAHELRSPLTALKLQVQLLRRAPDEAGRDAAAQALTAGVDRATRLVEQLLALARSDAATAGEVRPLPLAETVRQAMVDAGSLADVRGTRLSLDVAGEPVVVGDAAGLAALARNLVDNAVRYSPPGGRVDVHVEAEGGHAVLRVDDDGPGIPPADRERVFDRFVRRDGSTETGSGLGLAIVRQVALRQGAQVLLDDSPLGGLRVTVRWPAGPLS
jgi:two-component system OmpR family sensor kinase/two-component system sensor histidine kinase QseC